MSEPKPFASLSSGLLARKGAARPAMRPQGFGQSGASLEDLGWNDMGFEAPKAAPAQRDRDHDAFGEDIAEHPRVHHPTGLTPVESPVHGQQAALADRLAANTDEYDAVDEDYDDTAELYDPVAEAALAGADEEEDEPEAEPQPVFVMPAPAPIVRQPVSRARSTPGAKSKAAFTLRLDKDRHLKLRLACAVHGRSAQMLVTEALDQLLRAMPEVDDLAGKANRKG